LVAHQLASFLLQFTRNVFNSSFDLIFVHDHIPSSKLTGNPCTIKRLNLIQPPVCTVTNQSSVIKSSASKSPKYLLRIV
jgi:hypothetical protein